ncbi:histidine kinase [Flavobacterium sp. CYK-55]|uniref:helix-turn-helix and ligand-binding sensor domain-containing protein n=1 Tax=Flavobacterium sp. CYK-55 TaxID=2835529 RepID=UPI001BD00339|nr:histidine kinase [Flavobacterium sp. CYK-55]MBS7788162.1 histidine kinase [Flavobacterium sp. CYK-55]
MKKIFFYGLIGLLTSLVNAQELLPFVENFSKSNYYGDNQVWSMTQADDHALYFANNHYLLRYNGVRWEKYVLPNKTILRSVFAHRDKVYTGSYNEFGYWQRKAGKMQYSSLTKDKKLFTGLSINEEIWKIFEFKNKIVFQSFNELYFYQNNKIQKVRAPMQLSYCFVVRDTLFAATIRDGVYTYDNGKFEKKKNWSGLENSVIHSIDVQGGQAFVFTQKNGVFVEQNQRLVPWQNPLNATLKHELIITAKFTDPNRLVIGTAFKGVYIVDMRDGSYLNLNRSNSLKNNSVLSITFDLERDIWLGMDNGISHIEINSPYSIFSDNSGVLGSVYSLAPISGGYLLGSNHGAFKYQNKKVELLPSSQGQVWEVSKADQGYVIGHNDGTFVYQNGTLVKKNHVSGGWKFLKSDYDNKFYQANYSGIVVYDAPLNLAQYKIVRGLTKPIKNLAQNKPGELWAVDNYRSLYRITFSPDFTSEKVENITQANGMDNDYGVKMINFKNEILFYINNVWYHYNSIANQLEKNKIFNENFSGIDEVIPIDQASFIVLKDKLLYKIHQAADRYIWELIPEKYYEGKIINQDSKVFKYDNLLLMNLDDGFISFKTNNAHRPSQKVQIEAFYNGNALSGEVSLKHNQTLEVDVISPYFGYNRLGLFYTLNDAKHYWPVKNGAISLSNLGSGYQLLKVYYNDGEKFVELKQFEFRVDRPWYFSILMILVYILMVSTVFYLYYRWNKIRYIEKLKLKEEELKHQQQILELELIAESNLKMQEYEKNILEMQVQSKASELAGKSLSIAKQSEMIDRIEYVLDSETDINQLKSKIKKAIRVNALNQNEWQSFEKNLLQSHKDFAQKLTQLYPSLTSKDIKLCIYLKMNLSSKEIAPLMNISYRGVELHRYRLRKKLNLSVDENLSRFMINL